MNTGEKIDYMIQCLQVAKAECEHLNEWNAKDWEDDRDMKWLCSHRQPNKALIRENLRNVAMMRFVVANEVK
mgnify:FL=1